jgi:hypothetical protein
MPFVNELIPVEDIEKYQLAEIDEKFVVGGTRSRQWTIDRDRDIYLRNVARGAGSELEIRNQHKWIFYWKGYELTLRLDLIAGSGEVGEPARYHRRLMWVNGSNGLPASLKPHAKEILNDLKEALLIYKDFGIYSESTEFSLTLDLGEECVL